MGALRSSGALRNTLLEYLASKLEIAFSKATKAFGNAWLQGGNSFGATGVFGTNDNNPINVRTNGATVATYDTSGNFVPPADATGQIGTNALRWNLIRGKTITSGDLHLADEAGDAQWVIREAPGKLYAHDLISDQLYEIPLTPVAKPEGYVEPRRDIHHTAHIQGLLKVVGDMLAPENIERLKEAIKESGDKAAAGPSDAAKEELSRFTGALAEVQAVLAEHQDRGLGMHEELHYGVHDLILLHLDDLKVCVEKHLADEAASVAKAAEDLRNAQAEAADAMAKLAAAAKAVEGDEAKEESK